MDASRRRNYAGSFIFAVLRMTSQCAIDCVILAVTLGFICLAQDAEKLATFQGNVVDKLTSQPVAGARVIMVRADRPGGVIRLGGVYETEPTTDKYDPHADRIAVLTGDDGSFKFRLEAPARFGMFVEAHGYARPFRGIEPVNTHELKAGESRAGILIPLIRELTISGRVIDTETEQPLRGLMVMAQRYWNTFGPNRMLGTDQAATTGEDGRFILERLEPGEYRLGVRAPLGARLGDPMPVEDFRSAVLMAYGSTWYPGVARVEEALPLNLVEGVALEGIQIGLAKRRMASLRGRVLGDTEDKVSVTLSTSQRQIGSGQTVILARGEVKPGAEFQIDRVPPGVHRLAAETGQGAARQTAVLTLHVDEENQDGLDLQLRRGVTVTGRVRIEGRDRRSDQPALPASDVRIALQPLGAAGGKPAPSFTAPVLAEDGSFRFEGVAPDAYALVLEKLPQAHRVLSIRYNGADCGHVIVAIDPAAREQELEVTLAPAHGSVMATATDGTGPAAGASIVLVREPVDEGALQWGLRYNKAGADGRAGFPGLLPGTYRLVAYPAGEFWGEDPNLLQRVAAGAEVKITGNIAVTIQVRTEPMR